MRAVKRPPCPDCKWIFIIINELNVIELLVPAFLLEVV